MTFIRNNKTKISALSIAVLGLVALNSNQALAQDGPSVSIKNFIGTVNITTGDYDEITIDGDDSFIKANGADYKIDGGQRFKHLNCRTRNNVLTISTNKLRKKKYKKITDYPVINITAPEDVYLKISKSLIVGEAGDLGSADLSLSGCTDYVIGNVNGRFTANISGSGDLSAGNVGNLDAKISGSGDVEVGEVDQAKISVSGSGDFKSDQIKSLSKVSISGSGDVSVGDIGSDVDIRLSGSGDLELGAVSGGIDFQGSGASDTQIVSVQGGVDVNMSGASELIIDAGNARPLYVRTSGASDFTFNGTAYGIDAKAGGASDIHVANHQGEVKRKSGPAATIKFDFK